MPFLLVELTPDFIQDSCLLYNQIACFHKHIRISDFINFKNLAFGRTIVACKILLVNILFSYESVLKIIFTIQLGGFNIVTDKVEEWLNFTRKSNTLSVLAKKEFESKFENDLKAYNEATIKEFVEIYG